MSGYNPRRTLIDAVATAESVEDIPRIHALVGDLAVSLSAEYLRKKRKAKVDSMVANFRTAMCRTYGLADKPAPHAEHVPYTDRQTAAAGERI